MSETIKTTDFGSIHDALNKMILGEVKRVLELLPEKCMREEGCALCRIIIGPVCDYSPRNIAVDEVWVDEKDGLLHIYGRDLTHQDCFDQNWADNVEPDEWTENDDLYDITDFQYLIEQAKAKIPAEAWEKVDPISLTHYGEMNAVREALEKSVVY